MRLTQTARHVEQGANNNIIGTPLVADHNVISGNGKDGVGFWHEQTNNNQVQNNLIGLGPLGNKRSSNRLHGVDINFGSAGNVIGGVGPDERNVISGNNGTGVEISHTAQTTQNQFIGNFIGKDVNGTTAPTWSV